MSISRREFLVGTGAAAGAAAIGSIFGVAGPAFGAAPVDPAAARRNRLVVIFLEGGNDGLNYVVPRGDVTGAPRLSVYRRIRPAIAYKPNEVLALDRGGDDAHVLGFNPRLTNLHSMYREGRVAVVQGVDYPNHNYSHFASADIWHTGDPTKTGASGWLGRHVDRAGVGEGELRAVAISSRVPLMLQGRQPAAAISSIGSMRFRDGTGPLAVVRHNALAAMGATRTGDPLRQRVGASLRQTAEIVDDLSAIEEPASSSTALANSLLTARMLLEHDLGVECVYVAQPGYDTHTTQVSTHEQLLAQLDAALAAFWLGMKPDVAGRTMVMIVSEFGRRIGETNGGAAVAGTDHGAAAPVVLIGPPAAMRPATSAALVAGIHGDHPNMGTVSAPADNLTMTTDVRHLYQAVLQSWLGNPDPIYADAARGPLHGLFAAPRAPASRRGTQIGEAATLDRADLDATSTSVLGADGRPLRVAGRSASRAGGGDRRALHPVSVAAALAFNAFVAAVVVRSGRFREAVASWRSAD